MATANDLYQDAVIRRALEVEALGRRHADDVLRLLEDVEADLEERIRRRLEALGAAAGARARHRQLEELISAVREIRQRAVSRAFDQLDLDLKKLTKDEAARVRVDVPAAVGIEMSIALPPAASLARIAAERPLLGRLISDWAEKIAADDAARIEAAIRRGVVEGQTTDEIVRAVRGTRANKFTDGIIQATKRDAESLVLTATKMVSEASRDAVWAANSDIILGLRVVAVLDGRTSEYCRAADGKVTPLPGHEDDLPEGLPRLYPPGARPPFHWRCRSTMVAIFDASGLVGERPIVVDTRTRSAREVDFRADAKREVGGDRWRSMSRDERNAAIRAQRKRWAAERVGTVPADTTYSQFLSRQSAKFQDQVLGPVRGALFRRGGVALDDMVTPGGRLVPLAALREKMPKAFKKAGV